jgi:hypothetical protein
MISEFEKNEIFKYLKSLNEDSFIGDLDVYVKDINVEIKPKEKPVIKTVYVKQKEVKKKNIPSVDDIVEKLKHDVDFLSQLRTYPIWGSGGIGDRDANLIALAAVNNRSLNPKYFGEDENGTWRIVQDGDTLFQEYKYNDVWIPQCKCEATKLYENFILEENEYLLETEDEDFLILE